MNKFQFRAVVGFDITEGEAAAILADNNPNRAIDDWLSTMSPARDISVGDGYGLCHAAEQLKESFGKHLADKIVSDRKMLTAPIPVASETF